MGKQNDSKAWKVSKEILIEMYEEAEPGLDFEYALENPEEFEDGWYSNHYLSDERQETILDKHCEKYDLTDTEYTQITMTTILNYGPSNVNHSD